MIPFSSPAKEHSAVGVRDESIGANPWRIFKFHFRGFILLLFESDPFFRRITNMFPTHHSEHAIQETEVNERKFRYKAALLGALALCAVIFFGGNHYSAENRLPDGLHSRQDFVFVFTGNKGHNHQHDHDHDQSGNLRQMA